MEDKENYLQYLQFPRSVWGLIQTQQKGKTGRRCCQIKEINKSKTSPVSK